ncbi:hypothetical protein PA10_00115 [Pseudomonas phage pPa_SNUABM_DT01]|nr:hypothetical protein PA10_00115 [Pseudomonas phage pPa_SNUABM_DT01]
MSTPAPNVKSLFDEAGSHIVADRTFIRRLQTYRQNFANKNDDHVAFFGGHLMGVQDVRFTRADRNEWFATVLDIDDVSLQEDLLTLSTLVPDPKKVRYVSTDVMNLSCLWVVHKIFNSTHLNDKEKHSAIIDTLLILEYKFITSILAYWFPNRADEAVAVATYARLPKKYKLKELGSWGALLQYRAEATVEAASPHTKNKTYQKFDDDYDIIYMVNDIQGRIKGYLKNIRDEFEIVRRDPTALIRTNSNTTVNMDGEVVVKNKKSMYATYRRYLDEIIVDRNSFIVQELVEIVASTMPKLPLHNMVQALEYITSKSSKLKGDPDVAKLVDLTLEHLFDFIAANRNTIRTNDIPALLSKLSNLYKASRSNNDLLMQMRTVGEKIIRKAVKTKNDNLVNSIRTGVILYIVARTITMSYYRKS